MSRRRRSPFSNGCCMPSLATGARRGGLAWLLLLVLAAPAFARQDVPPPDPAAADSAHARILESIRELNAMRDSLRREAAQLRERDDREGSELAEELGREAGRLLAEIDRDSTLSFEFDELGDAISNFGRQLQDLRFEMDDRTIQLTSPDGRGFHFDIPEDLGDQISEGISSITATILADLPDTLDFEEQLRELRELREQGEEVDWEDLFREKREPEYKVVGDGVITFGDDIFIAGDEIVQGSVVAVFGDIEIAGRVEGNVVSIGGYVSLEEDAYVEGNALAILGDLERDESVNISGSVGSFDLSRFGGPAGLRYFVFRGAAGFASHVTLLLALSLMILLVFAVVPSERLERIVNALRARPRQALGAGLIWTVGGHLVLALLVALLVLTVIGIPLALLLILGYLVLGLAAIGAVAVVVGDHVVRRRGGEAADWVKILIGILVISLPTLVGLLLTVIPLFGFLGRLLIFAGILVHLSVYCFGTGTILLSRFGSGRINIS